ncbi:MAG: HAD-IIIC family phosphatase [Pseudomonadota bacterium]
MGSNPLQAQSLVSAARELLIPGSGYEQVDRIVTGLKRSDLSGVASLRPLRVKILGNITTDYITDYIRLMLVRAGYAPSLEAGHYGSLVRGLMGEVALTPDACDAAVVILTHRDIQFPPRPGATMAEARELVEREAGFWSSLLEHCKVPTAIVSFDLPPYRVLDEQDGLAAGGLSWHVKMTNLELAARLPGTAAFIDAEALQYRLGAARWHDSHLYHLCKQPFSMEALPEITHTIVAALIGLLGRGRKVLALDLDNTLWGGVIGDDGLQGIELGPETPDGEAFVAFQRYIKNLSQRGIILAVCSKNRDEVARSPFHKHSAMVLKEDDISCFVANFQDKASNLRHIAKTLNIGIDSIVFVDDNPVECALIRSELPEVLVVELSEDASDHIRALEASKAFPLRTLTSEDLGRVASYRAMGAVRDAAAAPGTDMEQFLAGLEPQAFVEKVDSSSVDRIVQLIRKTNQFKLNLSTFQEADIFEGADGVVALRLADRLQDYGIVAIAVTRPADGILNIQNWVMSCRVFGRRLENLMLEILRDKARQLGCTNIQAGYVATEKNVILPEVLLRIGFTAAANTYSTGVQAGSVEPHYMTIIYRR